jgi:hypothetical protein
MYQIRSHGATIFTKGVRYHHLLFYIMKQCPQTISYFTALPEHVRYAKVSS